MAIGTIGKYERLDVLGHGTSGVVYLAWDTLLRRQVALKEIRAAAPEMERVLEEARVLDRLRHPHIVHVHSVDQENGAILLDMELVRGQNLADLLRERNGEPLPPAEAGRIALAVLDALAYAHERRIIHRDIKPANILIGQAAGTSGANTVKLTDFGLAEALGSGSVAGGGGTYPYMAPEDFAEEESSDYRTDLWAVGVVLYEMLTSRRPFTVPRPKDPFAWKRAIENDQPPPVTALRPELPAALDAVIKHALAKRKGDRFPSARAFSDALRTALAGSGAAVGDEPHAAAREDAAVPPAAGAMPSAPFRFSQGGASAETLDDLLLLSVRHWDEARQALLEGRLERWLRSVGEIYIADLAAELAVRVGSGPDDLLREFLDRSGLDLIREARRREMRAEERRRAGDVAGAALLLAEARRLVPQPPAPPFVLRRAAPTTTEIGTRIAPTALPSLSPTIAPSVAPVQRRAVRSHWWFASLLALCLAPPAGALWNRMVGGDEGRDLLLLAWVASGFLAAALLIVGLAVRVPREPRLVCFVPLAGGLIAAGALTADRLLVHATFDQVALAAGGAALLLTVLLVESATALRLWRLWAFLISGAAMLTAALFAGI